MRKLEFGFLFAFHNNYGSILHHFRDKARYLSKIVIFFIPLAFDAPVRGVPVGLLPPRLVLKTRMIGKPDGKKILTSYWSKIVKFLYLTCI